MERVIRIEAKNEYAMLAGGISNMGGEVSLIVDALQFLRQYALDHFEAGEEFPGEMDGWYTLFGKSLEALRDLSNKIELQPLEMVFNNAPEGKREVVE